jgi:hypothetical protein
MEGTNGKERRRSKRHSVTDKIFLTVRPSFSKLGKVKDISKGGLSFEYVFQHYDACGDGGCAEVDIFTEVDDLYLPRIPCRQIYDVSVYQNEAGFMATRRCGLEFGRLTHEQISLLKLFITACEPGSSMRM